MQSNVISVDFRRRERATQTPRHQGLGDVMIVNFVAAWLMVGIVWWIAWWWR